MRGPGHRLEAGLAKQEAGRHIGSGRVSSAPFGTGQGFAPVLPDLIFLLADLVTPIAHEHEC